MKKQYRNTVKNYYAQNDDQAKQYFIVINGNKIEVSGEIYKAYSCYGNKERYFDDQYDKKYYIRLDDCPQNFHELIIEASEETAIRQLNILQLQKAIRELNMHEKKLIWLLYVEGYTSREAGSILGVAHTTVLRQKVALIMKLKKILEGAHQDGYATGNR